MERRPRPASLLRPQRQIGRKVAFGAVLLLVGGAGGFVAGLSLRPGVPPSPQQQRAEAPAGTAAGGVVAPGATLPAAIVPGAAVPRATVPDEVGLPKTALFAGASDARPAAIAAPAAQAAPPSTPGGEVETLRKNLAAEQARLESLTQARTAAEAQLAQLHAQVTQREILARREAALAALPSVTSPLPNPPAPNPSRRPEPRVEPTAGVGSGAAPSGTAPTVAPHAGQQRVVLLHRAGSYAASEAAGVMAAQARDAGFDLSDTRAVTATPSQRVVRYFHADDAPAAARLAGRLGRGWALQDFRSYEPLPTPGLLEVWLPDR